METRELSAQLSERLGLGRPPVALALADGPPEGVEQTDTAVPSACSFWRHAEAGAFYASAEQHFNCPIGAMTMGFDMPSDVSEQLTGLVEKMCAGKYISPDEPGAIPTMKRAAGGIVYGPLAAFPGEPDLILMWISPAQAMLYNEAAGSARWAEEMAPSLFGRPTCAALPAALEESRPTMSLGCIGMRTFTGVDAETMLGVVPVAEAEAFVRALATMADANAGMREFYEGRASRFGAAPTS